MKIAFHKMNGSGNDFILIDNRNLDISLSVEKIAFLCHRQRGIGSDGLLLVENGKQENSFRFRYYNADGKEAEMCGNGARCFSLYISKILFGKNTKEKIILETLSGKCETEILENNQVKVKMPPITDIQTHLSIEGKRMHYLNTGVPHIVQFVDNLKKIEINKEGYYWRNHLQFQPQGANVNFVSLMGEEKIQIRTYERGVEKETLACGTGAIASALISHLIHQIKTPIKVKVQNGDNLLINLKKTSNDKWKEIEITGPAEFNFSGKIEL